MDKRKKLRQPGSLKRSAQLIQEHRPLGRHPVYIDQSPIHGRGVFASQKIKAKTVIGKFLGEPARREGKFVYWMPCQKGEDWAGLKAHWYGRWWKGLRVTNRLKYANHSSDPNCRTWGQRLIALRDIEAGEEISWHYGKDWDS